MSAPQDDDFYVGYLRTPRRLAYVITGLVALALALVAADAVLIASLQSASGPGRWADTATRFEGTLVRDPYPILWVEADGRRTAYLLVADSKRSAEVVLNGLASGPAVVTGQVVERQGLTGVKMIEVNPGGAQVGTGAALSDLPTTPVAEVTLTGEIVDSKCWLGVMRPGEGRLHKGCATVCILGGIPPSLVTRGPDGATVAYVLTDRQGGAVDPAAIKDVIGDPISISGAVMRKGELLFLRADVASARRL